MAVTEVAPAALPLFPPVGDGFHPAVQTWFDRRFPEGPTPPQVQG